MVPPRYGPSYGTCLEYAVGGWARLRFVVPNLFPPARESIPKSNIELWWEHTEAMCEAAPRALASSCIEVTGVASEVGSSMHRVKDDT